MAGLHSGIFGGKFDCSVCQTNPKMRRAWGCESKAAMSESARSEVEDGVKYVYDRCLIRFIPSSVYKFIKIYDYYCKFTSAPMPAFTDVSPRFLLAYTYYESKLNQNRQELLKNG